MACAYRIQLALMPYLVQLALISRLDEFPL